MCAKEFSQISDLPAHLKLCKGNNKDFSDELYLENVNVDQSGNDNIEEYSTNEQLEVEMDVIDSVNLYECEKCFKTFNQKSTLNSHIRYVHGAKKHQCDQCPKNFSKRCDLDRHVTCVHEKVKNFKCEHCDYKCALQENLQKHMKHTHDSLKHLRCRKCEIVFDTPNELKDHSTQHEKEHQCNKCLKYFSDSNCLRKKK